MDIDRSLRSKIGEWLRRYLPLEIAGWIGELGAAALVYLWTGSLAAAAVAATVGASVGYYTPAYINAVRWSAGALQDRPWLARTGVANLLALRSLTVEFGPAEVIDSLLVRPALIFSLPLLLDNVVLGWVIGGFVSDVLFYVWTIFSYEKLRRFLAVNPSNVKETADGPVDSVATA